MLCSSIKFYYQDSNDTTEFYSPSCPSLAELLEGDTPGRCTMTVSAGISTPVDDATADELS